MNITHIIIQTIVDSLRLKNGCLVYGRLLTHVLGLGFDLNTKVPMPLTGDCEPFSIGTLVHIGLYLQYNACINTKKAYMPSMRDQRVAEHRAMDVGGNDARANTRTTTGVAQTKHRSLFGPTMIYMPWTASS